MDPVKLTVVSNEMEAEIVCGLLRENGIQCAMRKSDRAGAFSALSGGFAVDGAIEIVVHEQDLAAARELLPQDQPEGEG